MPKEFANEQCPACDGGALIPHADGERSLTHKGKEHRLNTLHYSICDKCGLRGMSEDQVAENAKLIAAFEDSIRDYISPKNIRRIRQKYKISQAEAGEIFQCGSSYFSKWERGEAAPTGTAAVALRSALKHPEVMKLMAAEAGVEISIPERQTTSATTRPVHKGETHIASLGRLIGQPTYDYFQFHELYRAALEKDLRGANQRQEELEVFTRHVNRVVLGLNAHKTIAATTRGFSASKVNL